VFGLINLCGIALYTYLFLQITNNIQHEQRASADFGDSLAFLTTAFPVLGFFVTTDLIWVAVTANRHRKHKDSRELTLFGLAALAAWIVTVLILRQAF